MSSTLRVHDLPSTLIWRSRPSRSVRLVPVAFVVLLVAALAGCADRQRDEVEEPVVDSRLDSEGFVKERFGGVRFIEQDLAGGEGSLRLHADIYLPDMPLDEDAPTKFPTILLLSPYWGGGTQGNPIGYMPYDFLVHRLLPRGYAIVFGDLGGNGGSGGCWDFMGPIERESAFGMVEAIAAQEWSDGQVGMFGLSYDGMTQVMAASDAAPHLVTVVPAAALTEAYRGLKMSGVHYGGGWHQTVMFYEQSSVLGPGPTNEPRRAGWIETVQQSPECMAGNHQGDAPTGAYTDYYKERDFRPFAPDVKASVFVTQGFLDSAVKPDNFGAWFDGITTLKKAWLGYWYHQYPTAEGAGRSDMYLTFHRWFDHTLYKVDNVIDREPMYDVQDSLGQWRHEEQWPPADATPFTLAASADGSLVDPLQAQDGAVTFGGVPAAADSVAGMGLSSVAWVSEPLTEDLHIVGVPVLNATFVPTTSTGYVIARLMDEGRMVSQAAFNGLFAHGLETAEPMQPGQPVRLQIAFYPVDWVAMKGHTLRLVLNTVDTQGWFDSDQTMGEFEIQAGPDARLEMLTIERGLEDKFLVSCGFALADAVEGCFKELQDEGVPQES
jgi:predicted acyl esterase